MKLRVVLFLLYSSLSFGQKPLEIVIDSITSSDTLGTIRKFTVNYHIQNTSDKEVKFINCSYPMTNFYPDVNVLKVYSVIVENDNYIRLNILHKNLDQMLYLDSLNYAKTDEERAKIIKNRYKIKPIDTLKLKNDIEKRRKINDFDYVKSSIHTFQPKETRQLTETFYWNKRRYYKVDDLEYYIDEKEPYYLELSMVHYKKDFQYFFPEEEYKKMKDNPNFLEGTILSNKMEINFKE